MTCGRESRSPRLGIVHAHCPGVSVRAPAGGNVPAGGARLPPASRRAPSDLREATSYKHIFLQCLALPPGRDPGSAWAASVTRREFNNVDKQAVFVEWALTNRPFPATIHWSHWSHWSHWRERGTCVHAVARHREVSVPPPFVQNLGITIIFGARQDCPATTARNWRV